ncbi:hypothetical protein DFH11DRAFT_1544812 [Phellopilus nigrolimitatus]|nr:hypothetical protein DFH11DRAFT_1544812 [Phellopilus nigrolimitatus]
MPFDVSAVPNEVWFNIALCSGLKDVLHLEALKHVHALDQEYAPDIPRHISVNDLDWQKLRSLVVRAHRRHFNCTSSRTTPLQPTREVEVPIGWMDTDGRRDGVGWRGCWDVQSSKCIWTYPLGAPNDARNRHTLKVRNFSYDMQANGDVRVLVNSRNIPNWSPDRVRDIGLQAQAGRS